jgi:hypothetical protein
MSNSPVNVITVFNALTSMRDESADVIAEQVELNVDGFFFS